MNFVTKGEMMALWSAFLCTTEMASYLSPPRGHSLLSPVTVVGIARHCGRVLGQARALGRLSNSVKPCFPHGCTLPQPGAPLLLGALQTTPAATVHSVHLPHGKKGKKLVDDVYLCLFSSVCVGLYTWGTKTKCKCVFSVCVHSPLWEPVPLKQSPEWRAELW